MGKEKIISLILRKETYKDLKPYISDIAALKQEATRDSAGAILQILTTDYNAQSQLFAVRYLKEAFEKGNPQFMDLVERDILPVLVNIVLDENKDKALIKYAGSSYTKKEELAKFKPIVLSLFRMSKECIIRWAEWVPDPARKFGKALQTLKDNQVHLHFEFKYFRPEHGQFFIENCTKNKVNLRSQQSQSKPVQKSGGDPLTSAIESALNTVRRAKSKRQIDKGEADFNQAINEYLQNASQFNEEKVQAWFDKLEQLKKDAGSKTSNSSVSQSKKEVVATPGGDEPSKKSSQKVSSSKQISKEAPQEKLMPNSYLVQSKQSNPKSNQSIVADKSPKKTMSKVEPRKSQEKIDSSNQSSVKKIPHPKQQQQAQQVATPSAKKGPLVFDDESVEEPKPVKVTNSKREHFSSKLESSVEHSVSKEERVNFSDEEQSEESERNRSAVMAGRNFTKKSGFAPILQEPQLENKSSKIQKLSSPRGSQKNNKAQMSALCSQNKSLLSKLDQVSKELEAEKKSKARMIEDRREVQAQLNSLRRTKQEYLESVAMGVTPDQINRLKRELKEASSSNINRGERLDENEKAFKSQISKLKDELEAERSKKGREIDEVHKQYGSMVSADEFTKIRRDLQYQQEKNLSLTEENDELKGELKQLKQQLQQAQSQINNKPPPRQQQPIKESRQRPALPPQVESRVVASSRNRPIVQEIDPDYIKDLTHPSNIHAWLNQVNTTLFKKNLLGLSDIYFRDDLLTMAARRTIYTQSDHQFVSMTLTFQFKEMRQVEPQAKYKNCQEIELWTKKLTGSELMYEQDMALRLHRHPLKIVKAELRVIEGVKATFLLPCVYFNFLREEEVSGEQFEEVFAQRGEHILKSKITQMNHLVARDEKDLRRVFKKASVGENRVRFCLAEGIHDHVLLGQFEFLRNSKFILKVLPIPYTQPMSLKARELIDNLVFLLS